MVLCEAYSWEDREQGQLESLIEFVPLAQFVQNLEVLSQIRSTHTLQFLCHLAEKLFCQHPPPKSLHRK